MAPPDRLKFFFNTGYDIAVVHGALNQFMQQGFNTRVNAMKIVIPIQQKVLARAKAKNHRLEIWVGLPTRDVLDDFLQYPGHENVTSLCELNPEDVRKANAGIWSPRWTLGTQLDLVREMHAEGRRVFCWTIDDQRFIKKFIDEGEFDGLLSNHSAMTAFYFYTQE